MDTPATGADSSALLQPHTEVPTQAAAAEVPQDQPQQTEASKEEAPKQDDKFASKFAALSAKEKAILAKEQKLKAQMKEFESQMKEFEELKNLRKLAKENPLEYLKKGELTYDEITKRILSGENSEQVNQFKTLEQQVQDLKQELERARQEQVQDKVVAFQAEIAKTIETNADKWELIRAFKSHDVVYNVIEQQFSNNQKLLSIEEAADLVEDYLQKEVEANAKLLRQTKKAQNLFGAAAEAATKSKNTQQAQVTEATTLTNKLSAEVPDRTHKPRSVEESLEQAAKLLRWE